MFRLVAGIVLGYALFAFAAVLIFLTLGREPHASPDPAFRVASIGAGIIAAFTGGYLGATVAKGRERTAGLAIAVIIGAMASVSLVAYPLAEAKWWQLAPLVTLCPAAFVGSLIRARRLRVR